jgi:tetratricopeptide (TPR) repeat protein
VASPAPGALLARAVAHHRQGALAEAAGLYQEVLRHHPAQPDALHLLGVLVGQAGQAEVGIALIRQALAVRPRAAEYHGNLANLLQTLGQLEPAVASAERATALDPDQAGLEVNLGNVRLALGRLAEAERAFQRALMLDPGSAEGYLGLGALYSRRGERPQAEAAWRQALALRPGLAEAHANLARSRQAAGILDEAVTHYRAALETRPADATLHIDLGTAYHAQGEYPAALSCHEAALALEPGSVTSLCNLGAALHKLRRFPEAEAAHRRALAIHPDHPVALTHLGAALAAQGDEETAIACHRAVLSRTPDCADARWNLSTLLLGRGELAEGWPHYDARWQTILKAAWRDHGVPLWSGQPLTGRRILVWREQGVGDEIMFASCIPDLVSAGASVILTATPKLRPLFTRAFPGVEVWDDWQLADAGALALDYHIPMGSLPRWLRPTLDRFPAHTGFLVPDPARAAFWRERLASLGPGLKVGISWRSRLMTDARRAFYSSLSDWGPIFRTPGVRLVNLQYDRCGPELAAAEAAFGVAIKNWDDLDQFDDLDGVAALVSGLDLVLAPDNSVGELSAALGRPVWRLDSGADWSAFGTGARPWQPSMQLFQRRPGTSWADLIEVVGRALADFQASRG